jgi:hypothetical protein
VHGPTPVITMLVIGTLATSRNEEASSRFSPEFTTAAVLASEPPSMAAGAPRVWLCHWRGDGEVQLIFVATPAVTMHLAHGDYRPYMSSPGPSCE